MPKFLVGCHYNKEEISRNLKKKRKRIVAGPNEWQQVCNWSNPEKTGRSCEGADFSWLSSKVSQTLTCHSIYIKISNYLKYIFVSLQCVSHTSDGRVFLYYMNTNKSQQ
jgi:hypothetical protein